MRTKDATYFVRVGHVKRLVESCGVTHSAIAVLVGCSQKAVTELVNGICGSEALLSAVERATGQLAGERFVALANTISDSMTTHSGLAPSFTLAADRAAEQLQQDKIPEGVSA